MNVMKSTFKVFIKYIHVFIWLSELGGRPAFGTGPDSVSPLSGPVQSNGMSIKNDELRAKWKKRRRVRIIADMEVG
jgi:hypothetical protein